jgi:hypothetical protein
VLSEDHSCRDAVSRIIAHRAANGLGNCSPRAVYLRIAHIREPSRRPPPPPLRKGGRFFAAKAPSYSPPCEGGAGGVCDGLYATHE